MTASRFATVTHDLTDVTQCRNLKERAWFQCFNAHGLVAHKAALDQRVTAAVDAGRCKSGALLAYGSFCDFGYRQLFKVVRLKQVSRRAMVSAETAMKFDIESAQKFLDTLG